MNRSKKILVSLAVGGLFIGLLNPASAADLGTAFTYQGQLEDNGAPAGGPYDLQFRLLDAAGGNQVGATIQLDNVPMTDGIFTVSLDFGEQFNGDARWLEVGVHPGAEPVANPYTILSPQQPLTAAPYALGLRLPFREGIDTLPLGRDVFSIRNNAPTGRTVDILQNSANPAAALLVNAGVGPAIDVEGGYTRTNGTGSATSAALRVKSSETFDLDYLLVDGSGLDHDNGPLQLQANTNSNVTMVEGGGQVGIGTNAPGRLLQVGQNTTPNSEGMIRLASRSGTQGSNRVWDIGVPETDSDTSGIGYSFVIDDTALGTTPEVLVKWGTGNVGIGTIAPAVKLHIVGGTDAALGGGGYIVAGSTTSTNISIDNNEIMARNNGAAATLTLNNDGGDVKIGGAIDLTYLVSVASTCPAGTKVVGGGCDCDSSCELNESRPLSDGSGWVCTCQLDGDFHVCADYVICMSVK